MIIKSRLYGCVPQYPSCDYLSNKKQKHWKTTFITIISIGSLHYSILHCEKIQQYRGLIQNLSQGSIIFFKYWGQYLTPLFTKSKSVKTNKSIIYINQCYMKHISNRGSPYLNKMMNCRLCGQDKNIYLWIYISKVIVDTYLYLPSQ